MSPSEQPNPEENLPDGGAASAEDIFNRVSDVGRRSRKERITRRFNKTIVTPLKIMLSDSRGVVGLSILTVIVGMGTVGTWWFDKPSTMEAEPFVSPFQSLEYPLGTGNLGQEIHLQIIHATPAMLKFVISGAVVATVIGVIFGVVAGYKGGSFDYVLMLISDTWQAIPALVLIIVLSSFWQPRDPYLVGFMLGVNYWGGLARAVRSEVLSIRESNMIEAARVMDLSTFYILRKYIVKNLMPYITVNLANNARMIIFAAVGLYFIGVLPYTSLNWGVMMDQAYSNSNLTNLGTVHWLIIPMIMLILLTLGIILTAQAADKIFNVRLIAREKSYEEESDPTLDTPSN